MSCNCYIPQPTDANQYVDIRSMCCGSRRGQKNFWYCRNAVEFFLYTMSEDDKIRFGMEYNNTDDPDVYDRRIFKGQTLKTALLNEFNCPKTRILDVMIEIMERTINSDREYCFEREHEMENDIIELEDKIEALETRISKCLRICKDITNE